MQNFFSFWFKITLTICCLYKLQYNRTFTVLRKIRFDSFIGHLYWLWQNFPEKKNSITYRDVSTGTEFRHYRGFGDGGVEVIIKRVNTTLYHLYHLQERHNVSETVKLQVTESTKNGRYSFALVCTVWLVSINHCLWGVRKSKRWTIPISPHSRCTGL